MAKVTKVKITRRIRRGENIIRGIPIPEKTKQRRQAAKTRAAIRKTILARKKRKAAEKRAKERGR